MKYKNVKYFDVLVKWLPLGFAITMLCGYVFVTNQFMLRSAANEPQVQMARDITANLTNGMPYNTCAPLSPVDLRGSLAPYVLLYDENHAPMTTGALLDGMIPVITEGVFAYAKAHGEHHLTWQPARGVREAIVVIYHAGLQPGYVVVGRSLQETELRESQLFAVTEIIWSLSMLGTLFLSVLVA